MQDHTKTKRPEFSNELRTFTLKTYLIVEIHFIFV